MHTGPGLVIVKPVCLRNYWHQAISSGHSDGNKLVTIIAKFIFAYETIFKLLRKYCRVSSKRLNWFLFSLYDKYFHLFQKQQL